ncbi:MAG TPA: isoaspartyl peptidase/L-asparaginase [Longimicrobiales bacterium]
MLTTRTRRRHPVRRAGTLVLAGLGTLAACASQQQPTAQEGPPRWGIVVHGGAGTILRENMTPEMETAYRAKMEEAIRAGHTILAGGGTSLDAVVAAIQVLEDSPLFNAGKGAVFTHEGTNELDASIMDGATLHAGAVAGVKHIKSPIALARLVMEKSPHVMMAREGAEAFAQEQGIELVPEDYFYTERRWKELQEAKAAEAERTSMAPGAAPEMPVAWKVGTVGAVALDQHGNLAAGTSTGGMTNKRFGRIGDSPIIGAGTYANNESCAVSATGHGEYFIRNVVAYDICARMLYTGVSLEEAANAVVMEKLVERGGDGGVIAIDRHGNIAMPFNTPGMYRGYAGPDGRITVKIYKDEAAQ